MCTFLPSAKDEVMFRQLKVTSGFLIGEGQQKESWMWEHGIFSCSGGGLKYMIQDELQL